MIQTNVVLISLGDCLGIQQKVVGESGQVGERENIDNVLSYGVNALLWNNHWIRGVNDLSLAGCRIGRVGVVNRSPRF